MRRNCTGEDVWKAYKKLSLKVHPDNNKAPGAEEAFKMMYDRNNGPREMRCRGNEDDYNMVYDIINTIGIPLATAYMIFYGLLIWNVCKNLDFGLRILCMSACGQLCHFFISPFLFI